MDGVDDHKVRFFLFDQATDLVHIVFGGQKNIVLRDLQAGCTQLDLSDRFFARDIQNAMLIGNGTAQLQQHGGFAHARLAAQQHNAAQHDAASTRSSSEMPVRMRLFSSVVLISDRRRAVRLVTPSGRAAAACRAAAVPAFGASATTSSFMVFQLPQLGQRPIQRGLVSPQLEQT
jgi:hypothetical protein